MGMIPAIDAHHHFWDPEKGDYSWMSKLHAPIRRIFNAEDLRPELAAAGISKTVLVQMWSSFEESQAFLRLAADTNFVAGVVGWVDLAAPDAAAKLDVLLSMPQGKWLVGVCHQVHDEPDPDWILRNDVRRGLTAVSNRGLTYDLLVHPRELPASLEIVKKFPNIHFIIDHVAKPDIRAGEFDLWAEALRPFAEHRSHAWCKLSGMVTEADWSNWKPEKIMPYLQTAIQIFGPDRCMFGSDWPVCLLAATYKDTIALVRDGVNYLSADAQKIILFDSAVEAYRLGEDRL
jgi:L-fuconolactonase